MLEKRAALGAVEGQGEPPEVFFGQGIPQVFIDAWQRRERGLWKQLSEVERFKFQETGSRVYVEWDEIEAIVRASTSKENCGEGVGK